MPCRQRDREWPEIDRHGSESGIEIDRKAIRGIRHTYRERYRQTIKREGKRKHTEWEKKRKRRADSQTFTKREIGTTEFK